MEAAAARVRDALSEVLPAPGHVVAGPAAEPGADALPLLVLTAGRWQAAPAPPESDEAGARAREARQRIDPAAGAGPYPLDHTPLPGSARGRLVLAEGTVAERTEPLLEGRDLEVDPGEATFTLRFDLPARRTAHAARIADQVQARVGRPFNLDSPQELSEALFGDLALPPQGSRNVQGFYSTARPQLEAIQELHPVVPLVIAYRELKAGRGAAVLLDYAFAGTFAVREFRQALELDAYAADAAGAERLASLAAAALLTHTGALLDSAALDHPSRRTVSTRHEVTRLELGEGAAERFDAGVRQRIVFQARGRLTFAREEPASLAVLRHVRSPGTYSPEAVSVEPELG